MEHPPYWAAEAVAAFLREQSAWRLAQHHRFPSDDRNQRSARALEELALHVEGLPDGDLALQELVTAGAFDDRGRFIATDDARRAVARFGFDWTTTPRAVLQELARATWRGRRKPAQNRTSPMTLTTAPAMRTITVKTYENNEWLTRTFIGRWLVTNFLDPDPAALAGLRHAAAELEDGTYAIYEYKGENLIPDDDVARLRMFDTFEDLDGNIPDDLFATIRGLNDPVGSSRTARPASQAGMTGSEWVKEQPNRPWHLVDTRLPGDRAQAVCGAVLELGGGSAERGPSERVMLNEACAMCDDRDRRRRRLSAKTTDRETRERAIVARIFELAITYDRLCDAIHKETWRLLGIGGSKQIHDVDLGRPQQHRLEDLLLWHQTAIADVTARIAKPAADYARSLSILSQHDEAGFVGIQDVLNSFAFGNEDAIEFLRPLFASAGISNRLMSLADPALPGDLISVEERRSIAVALRSAQNALRDVGSPPTAAKVALVEAHLRDALDEADVVPAYRIRLEDATQCVKNLLDARTSGDRLELVGRAHSAIATVLENLEV